MYVYVTVEMVIWWNRRFNRYKSRSVFFPVQIKIRFATGKIGDPTSREADLDLYR